MTVQIENATKQYEGPAGTVLALDGVSLEVGKGEFVAVRGPSGCGKSTLLLAAGGLLRPDGGRVVVEGESLFDLSADKRARFRSEKIGFVFQQFHLIPYLTVLDNVLAPTMTDSKPDRAERARELLRQFGLMSRAGHVPAALSTGERQRTALARALLNGPSVLLADEPTGNLDEKNGEAVLGYLKEFAGDGGCVLLVTHDPRVVEFADRVLAMENGRLEATPEPVTG